MAKQRPEDDPLNPFGRPLEEPDSQRPEQTDLPEPPMGEIPEDLKRQIAPNVEVEGDEELKTQQSQVSMAEARRIAKQQAQERVHQRAAARAAARRGRVEQHYGLSPRERPADPQADEDPLQQTDLPFGGRPRQAGAATGGQSGGDPITVEIKQLVEKGFAELFHRHDRLAERLTEIERGIEELKEKQTTW